MLYDKFLWCRYFYYRPTILTTFLFYYEDIFFIREIFIYDIIRIFKEC